MSEASDQEVGIACVGVTVIARCLTVWSEDREAEMGEGERW